MASGQVIRRELWRYGLIELIGSASGGAANYITDVTRLQSNSLSASAFDDCYVRFTDTTNNDGALVKVDYLDTTNGRLYLTPSPAGGVVAANDLYEVWKAGINPDDVDRARDEALTRLCSVWTMHPISLCVNAGYMDAIGSDWALIATGTRAIQVLSFPYEFATNTILLTNAAANDGIQSQAIYVRPNQSFYLYVPVSVQVGTAEVQVRDVTNGADISLSGTSTATLRGWTGIEVTFSIPIGCGEIRVRLRGQGATAVIEWGPVYFHGQEMRAIQLPARVTSREHVGPVYYMTNVPTVSGGVYWGEETIEERMGIRRQQVGDAVRLLFEDIPSTFPHAYLERDFYDALSTDYLTAAQRYVGDVATTTCPTDYVAPAMVRILAEQYIRKQPGQEEFWARVLQQALSDLASAERTYGPLPFPTQERNRVISLPILEV